MNIASSFSTASLRVAGCIHDSVWSCERNTMRMFCENHQLRVNRKRPQDHQLRVNRKRSQDHSAALRAASMPLLESQRETETPCGFYAQKIHEASSVSLQILPSSSSQHGAQFHANYLQRHKFLQSHEDINIVILQLGSRNHTKVLSTRRFMCENPTDVVDCHASLLPTRQYTCATHLQQVLSMNNRV